MCVQELSGNWGAEVGGHGAEGSGEVEGGESYPSRGSLNTNEVPFSKSFFQNEIPHFLAFSHSNINSKSHDLIGVYDKPDVSHIRDVISNLES